VECLHILDHTIAAYRKGKSVSTDFTLAHILAVQDALRHNSTFLAQDKLNGYLTKRTHARMQGGEWKEKEEEGEPLFLPINTGTYSILNETHFDRLIDNL